MLIMKPIQNPVAADIREQSVKLPNEHLLQQPIYVLLV